jgi:hypothetical protein
MATHPERGVPPSPTSSIPALAEDTQGARDRHPASDPAARREDPDDDRDIFGDAGLGRPEEDRVAGAWRRGP